MFTIDASVWVNAYSPAERWSHESNQLLDKLSTDQSPVMVPYLLVVEIAGAIRRIRNDAPLANEIASTLLNLANVQWISLDEALAQQSMDLAVKYSLRGADAVYAAVALRYQCVLVSLDHEHLTRSPPLIRTLTPANALAELTGQSPMS